MEEKKELDEKVLQELLQDVKKSIEIAVIKIEESNHS